MKLNNKLKLSLIAIATLTTANVNAQTYYSCIPEGCPAGQYFDGRKCLPIENLITTQLCPPGYVYTFARCCRKKTSYYFSISPKNMTQVPVSNKGVNTPLYKSSDTYSFNLDPDDYIEYINKYNKRMRAYGVCEQLGLPSSTFGNFQVELDP